MDGKAPLSLPARAGREEPPVINCECPAFLKFPDNVRECRWGGGGRRGGKGGGGGGKEMVTKWWHSGQRPLSKPWQLVRV